MTEHHAEQRPLRLGFVRGTAPSKWAKRWQQAGGAPLELVPLHVIAFGRNQGPIEGGPVDVTLERTRPGEFPEGAAGPNPSRHAVRLYTEAVALVVSADHELAGETSIAVSDLGLVTLLDHGDHLAQWPKARPWEDPSWKPAGAADALALVATGAGAILLPLPLARQLSSRREHAVLPVVGDDDLEGGMIWASWDVTRDAADVQQLAGIMRGRTARSSRSGADGDAVRDPQPSSSAKSSGGQSAAVKAAAASAGAAAKPSGKKSGPKPGSRGAQLAASRAKAERAQAIRRAEKRRKQR